MACELIIGGSRSGKSALAEQRAHDSGWPVSYIATATAEDAEMAARIARHQARRPGHWRLIEEPLHLARALQAQAAPEHCVLVDCLTLWLANLACWDNNARFIQERKELLDVLPKLPGYIILVSNEVGMGIVPLGEVNRRFSDEAGWLNQAVAKQCERVTLTIAGLPYPLKAPPV